MNYTYLSPIISVLSGFKPYFFVMYSLTKDSGFPSITADLLQADSIFFMKQPVPI